MPIIPASDAREFATAGAVMTTLASPTLGSSELLSLWRVRMSSGQTGPDHIIDSEQIWTLTSGTARIVVDGSEVELRSGDSFIAPGGSTRRIGAVVECEFLVCGFSNAFATTPSSEADPQSPPWVR